MNNFIKTFLFFSITYCSHLSMSGFGEYVEDSYSNFLFITEPSPYFVENNFSSIWKGTDSALTIDYSIRSSKSDNFNLADSYLSSINYAFPLTSLSYFSIGFSPYTISDVDFYTSEYLYVPVGQIESVDSPIAYNLIYDNDGGISKSYLNFTTKISKKIFLSFKYSYLFGNLERNKTIRLYNLNYSLDENNEMIANYLLSDSILINSANEFSGSSLQIESKYETDKIDFFMSGTYHFPLNVESKFFFSDGISNMQNLEQLQTYFQPNQSISYENERNLKNFYIGLRYKMDNIQSFLLKLDQNKAFEYNENSMYLPDFDSFSVNFSYNSSSKIFTITNLNYINYKIGLFYKSKESGDISDYDSGLEIDYGFRLSNKNYFGLSLRFGEKTFNSLQLYKERYYFIGLKIENIEQWFLKGAKK